MSKSNKREWMLFIMVDFQSKWCRGGAGSPLASFSLLPLVFLNGHFIDHFVNTVDASCRFGDVVFFSGIFRFARDGHYAIARFDFGADGACGKVRHLGCLHQGGDGGIVHFLRHRAARCHGDGHFVFHGFDPLYVSRISSGEIPLCHIGGLSTEDYGSVFCGYLGLHEIHIGVKKKCGLHFETQPSIRVIACCFFFEGELIVHALDARQSLDCICG